MGTGMCANNGDSYDKNQVIRHKITNIQKTNIVCKRKNQIP